MMAYKPLRLVSRHASILGPSQPLQIMKENAGNADSSRARSVRISVGVAPFDCSEGHCVGSGSMPMARLGPPFLRLAGSCLHLRAPRVATSCAASSPLSSASDC